MKPQTIFILVVLAVYVSCSKIRMLKHETSGYKVNCKNFDEATGTCL